MSDTQSVFFLKRASFWRNVIIQLVLFALIYVGFQFWQSRNTPTGKAPVIDARLITGDAVSLAQYVGKPVLVHFWASWCPICRFEESTIASLSTQYPVITVASQSGSTAEVAAYMKQQNIAFPVIVDEEGDWAQRYAVRGFPSSFIIDAQGNIFDVEVGYSSYWGLRLRLMLADWFK